MIATVAAMSHGHWMARPRVLGPAHIRPLVYLIEEATATDLPQVMHIATESLTERYDPSLFYTMLELGLFLVARDVPLGNVVGFAIATRTNQVEARLLTIALRPNLQGRGLGGRLLREVEMRMRQGGALELNLEVREDNVRAMAFYRRKGYDLVGRMMAYYQDGAQALVLRKAL